MRFLNTSKLYFSVLCTIDQYHIVRMYTNLEQKLQKKKNKSAHIDRVLPFLESLRRYFEKGAGLDSISGDPIKKNVGIYS